MIERLLLVAIVSTGLACAGGDGRASAEAGADAGAGGAALAGEAGGAPECPARDERVELVRVTDLAPAVREDLRYATGDNFTGEPLDMGTAYDHFGPESLTANATGRVLANRRLLLEAMEAEGWENYAQEWWHFTHPSEDDHLDVPIGCWVG